VKGTANFWGKEVKMIFKKEEMKPVFVAMMAVTFVLGMGFVGIVFILAKIAVREIGARGPSWNHGIIEPWNNGCKRKPRASYF